MFNLVGNPVANPAQDLDWLDIAEQGTYNQQPKNGGAYTTPQQQIGQAAVNRAVNPFQSDSSSHGLTDEHLNPPNAQGIRTFTDSGKQYLNNMVSDSNSILSSLLKSDKGTTQLPAEPGLQPLTPFDPNKAAGDFSAASTGARMVGATNLAGGLSNIAAFL